MSYVVGYTCTVCGARYGCDETQYVCPQHGNEGILDVAYDYDGIAEALTVCSLQKAGECSMWRYMPLLPVDEALAQRIMADTPLASVGWTPLYRAPRLAKALRLRDLWVKDEGRQPTASLKDRASAIALVKAAELGYEVVTTASTGNAAAALAGLAAAVGQRTVIFVPKTAPEAKVAQLLVYGATVMLVDGTYDEAFELCLETAPAFGWYNRNTAYNPLMSEGKKSVVFEVCEQLTEALGPRPAGAPLQTPDCIFVAVGDGCIIGAVHKGLRDMAALGWIDRLPRIIGVQAAGSSALVDAWERGLDPLQMRPIDAHTIADSISAGLPRDRIKALQAARETDGAYVRVSDADILAAIPEVARGCGVFAEPAAAAAYAGLKAALAQGVVGQGERVVVLSTGSGLKDIPSARKAVGEARVIKPDLQAVREALP
jgi:threonine synthase